MSRKTKKSSLISLPVNFSFDSSKTEEKQIVEIDPNKIAPGEIGIIKVGKWGGFSSKCFAVMNVDGKEVIIRLLAETRASPSH